MRKLEDRGYHVRRLFEDLPLDVARSLQVTDAIRDGFYELMWIDPRIAFHADDVERMRRLGLPIVAGLCPDLDARQFACDFLPETGKVPLGAGGGLIEVLRVRLGFTLIQRGVFGQIQQQLGLTPCDWRDNRTLIPWFRPLVIAGEDEDEYLSADHAFCHQSRQCGFSINVYTSIHLLRMEEKGRDWEQVAGVMGDADLGLVFMAPAACIAAPRATIDPREIVNRRARVRPDFDRMRDDRPSLNPSGDNVDATMLKREVRSLGAGFPKINSYMFTYPKNLDSFESSLANFRASDWGCDPATFVQPSDWPSDVYSASRTYRTVLERAVADDCDFALILEDDVRVSRRLRANIVSIPLVRRDQCDYLSLFIPDLIADPWERSETHLGYRLARPRYSGPNDRWMRERLWGSQGYLLSRRFIIEALTRWDRLTAGQDCRVISVCSELKLPMWYTAPCLIEHAPIRSAFATPATYAPDFDPDFSLGIGPGFQPPEGIDGWLTIEEGRLLWEVAAGRSVLELGTASGRATVCLAQQARSVITIDLHVTDVATEWIRRYGLSDRVALRNGRIDETCADLEEVFDLAFIDADHDAAAVARNIASALRVLRPGGMIAFHDYPDPGWPDVRRVVDEHAHRLGWRKIRQVGYCAAFSTPQSRGLDVTP